MLNRNGVITRSGYIYKNVMDAMQEADEIDGVEDARDYQFLMMTIAKVAIERLITSIENE